MSVIDELIKKIKPKSRKTKKTRNDEEQELYKRRDVIVKALDKAIDIFASYEEATFDEVVSNGIRPLADAMGLDRVVFYTYTEKEGADCFEQIYCWDKSKGGLMPPDNDLRILPDIPVMRNLISIISKGERVRLRESDYSKDDAAFFGAYGIRSILVIPVFTRRKLWGFVSFQDHTNNRYFDEGCADLLHSAMRIFSNAIIRTEMTDRAAKAIEALKHRDKMLGALNRVAIKFLSHSAETFEDVMTVGVRELADAFDLDRLSIWRNIAKPEAMHASQIYRWDRESGGGTTPTKGLESVAYAQLAPRWEKLFANDEMINSPVKLLPEAAMLQSFGVVSAFVMPLFINNVLWGFALLEDRHTERFFDDDSVGMMRSAAFLCANTVIRAEMERSLTGAHEFTRAVLDASPISFTVFDEDARVLDCNDATLQALGTTKERYMNHFNEFSPEYQSDGEKSADKAVDVIRRSINGEKLVLEWTSRSSTGELIPYDVTMMRTMYNRKYVAMGYQYDLRNIRKMEEDIRQHGELLKVKLEQQELISEISRSFISSGNSQMLVKQAIAKLGNYHKVSLVYIFGIDYQRSNTYLAYHWVADNTSPLTIKFDFLSLIRSFFPERLPDSTTTAVIFCDDIAASQNKAFHPMLSLNVHAFICAPLYVDGHLWGVLSVAQNYTSRVWTSVEKSFVGMIANTVSGIIMRDIYNTKLEKALDKANEASKAKGNFLSNMSHEMRTPLNAITGMTAIGKNAKDIERKDYALSKINDASTHLLGVISDVLDMSKIEANKLDLSLVEFNFEKMLQKVVAVVNFRVDEKHQKFTVHIDREIPKTLITDDQRLAQVITNLLGNAVKFTSENGAITLDTRYLGEKDGLCTIQVSVTDTGIGINQEQQKRLFTSFQQAESSTTRKYGGTGLGLVISKSIVEMMNGKIWVESESGKGSTFTFTIQAKRGTKEKKSLLTPGVNLSNVRILIVDDEPDVLVYFSELTQEFGVHCDTAASGEEALRLIEQKGYYHIYFVDWKMPGMNGIQLSRELKTHTSENSVVIMISAAEWTTIADDAKKAGVDKFLPKPLFSSAVADIINECVGVDEQKENEEQTDITGIFKGRRVLLVEDVEINREVVMALLEPTQVEIDCAENGVQAVRIFSENPDRYNLIFMDVQMPEMDGYEATRHIRALDIPAAKAIPIIAMTANVFREDIEKCMEAGMNGHIGKPIDFDEVMGKLKSYLLSKGDI